MSPLDVVRKLRADARTDTVHATFTGAPDAVRTVLHLLSAVFDVTAMRHSPAANTTTDDGSVLIRLDFTCHTPKAGRHDHH